MDNPSQHASQEPGPASKSRRPNRNFPMYFVDDPDHPGKMTIMMADQLAAYQAKLEAEAAARQVAEEERQAATEAERAAGRPANTPTVSALTEVKRREPSESEALRLSPATPPDYSRHSRRCLICAHPDRDAIEGDFVRWRSPKDIAKDYNLSDCSSLYRHVHATGLFERRRCEIARVLENALEQAESCPFNEFDIITRAVRVYCRLDQRGRLYEPPRTLNVNITRAPADAESTGARSVLASASPEIDLAVGRGQET